MFIAEQYYFKFFPQFSYACLEMQNGNEEYVHPWQLYCNL